MLSINRKTFSASLVRGLLMACLAGSVWAGNQEDYDLGFKRYQEGDVVGAMTPLKRSAGAGHLKSMVLLAEILDRSEFDEEAVAWYRKAAEKGDLDGMVGYGTMLASGEGVKKNLNEAHHWMLKAAEQGQTQAISIMAEAYLNGGLGLAESERNTPKALHWVTLAAKQDFLPAVDALAEAYRTGRSLGVAANPELAEEFQNQANRIRRIEPAKGKKKARKAQANN